MISVPLFQEVNPVDFCHEEAQFGGHESFALRYSWLSKGYQAFTRNPHLFNADSAGLELGVGSNMVRSIHYWLRAARLIHVEPRSTASVTTLGNMIFDETTGVDPYLEDEGTLWLIHWLIASNSRLATTYFWFFNYYHKANFTALELSTALNDFAQDKILQSKRSTPATRQKAVQVLLRMYTQSRSNSRAPIEDALDSPVSSLGLINHSSGDRSYLSRPSSRMSLPSEIVGFAILQVMNSQGAGSIPIEDLMLATLDRCAPGSVFRLSENDLVRIIEDLIKTMPRNFELRDSGGINQLYLLSDINPVALLRMYYDLPNSEEA
jgi:hypothetical protein